MLPQVFLSEHGLPAFYYFHEIIDHALLSRHYTSYATRRWLREPLRIFTGVFCLHTGGKQEGAFIHERDFVCLSTRWQRFSNPFKANQQKNLQFPDVTGTQRGLIQLLRNW